MTRAWLVERDPGDPPDSLRVQHGDGSLWVYEGVKLSGTGGTVLPGTPPGSLILTVGHKRAVEKPEDRS